MTKNDVEKIAAFIEEFSVKNNVFEDEDALRFTDIGNITDHDLLEFKNIRTSLEEICSIYIQAEVDLEIEIDKIRLSDFENQTVSFILAKKKQEGRVIFFTEKAFSVFLVKTIILPRVVCLIGVFDPFCTFTTSIKPPYAKCDPSDDLNGMADARTIIKNLTGEYNIISDIHSWILADYCDLKNESHFYKIFLTESCKKLFVLLSTEVFSSDGITYLEFSCDRKVRIDVGLLERDSDLFYKYYKDVATMVIWVFENHNEVETRHTLLNYQLAIESITYESIRFENFLLTLQNAKNSYNYFLRSKSKEMMRSLSDLKKKCVF